MKRYSKTKANVTLLVWIIAQTVIILALMGIGFLMGGLG
jgi:hypothetical protein